MTRNTSETPAGLTPQQKRAKREDYFLNPPGVVFNSPAAEKSYRERAQRLIDVYAVRTPDRIPVSQHFGTLPLRLHGVDYFTGMQDYAQAAAAYRSFNQQYSETLETWANPGAIPPWTALSWLDYGMYAWPGHGLPRQAGGFQFVEGEYMQAQEYRDLIRNPSDFWMRTYLPRIFGGFAPFTGLDSLTDLIEIPTGSLMPLAGDPLQDLLRKLLAAGLELEKRNQAFAGFAPAGLAAGFPAPVSYFGKAPFDVIGDTLRGTQGIMKDMYRHPEELLEAMEVIADLLIKSVLSKAERTHGLIVGFPLHKGADGWMSQKQFDKFYWPTLKKVINAFIAEGLIISLFAEGSYNSRLDSVNEFPTGAIHWWFDRTDIFQAKKVLGSRCSLAGNLPSSLLLTGRPEEVAAVCRELIEKCGPGGGYILSSGAADVESNIDNLTAMVNCARQFGHY